MYIEKRQRLQNKWCLIKDFIYVELTKEGFIYKCGNTIESVKYEDIKHIYFQQYKDYHNRSMSENKYFDESHQYTISEGIGLFDRFEDRLAQIAFTDIGAENIEFFLKVLIDNTTGVSIGEKVKEYLNDPKGNSLRSGIPKFGVTDPSGRLGCFLVTVVPLLFILISFIVLNIIGKK
jgi:hypothetical protein